MLSNKILIKAQAFDSKTGKPISGLREEVINLKENSIFKDCKTIWDIHRTYESFWNELNDNPSELVFVQEIKIKTKEWSC